MKDSDLQRLTEDLSMRYFGKPFRHQAIFNPRLRTIGGRYMLQSHNIEINAKHYTLFGKDELVGIIKHELCHYHLHIEGKGYKHRDADFKALMKQVGAPRFCSSLPAKQKRKGKIYIFRCKDCRLEYIRRRKVNTNRYVCGKCRGKLQEINADDNINQIK